MPTEQDWSEWHKERENFKKRDTEGFTKDMAALGAHIKALRDVCPKDKAGVPVTAAFLYLDEMVKDYNTFAEYLLLNH